MSITFVPSDEEAFARYMKYRCGRLCYCSGQVKGSSARDDSLAVSEEIEKDAIKAISYMLKTVAHMRPSYERKHLCV